MSMNFDDVSQNVAQSYSRACHHRQYGAQHAVPRDTCRLSVGNVVHDSVMSERRFRRPS